MVWGASSSPFLPRDQRRTLRYLPCFSTVLRAGGSIRLLPSKPARPMGLNGSGTPTAASNGHPHGGDVGERFCCGGGIP